MLFSVIAVVLVLSVFVLNKKTDLTKNPYICEI